MREKISEKIKKEMQVQDVSINELAKMTRLSRNTVLRVLNCRPYSIVTIETILKTLKIEL